MRGQTTFQACSGLVALWFGTATAYGADTMPRAIYGAANIIPPGVWAAWIIVSVAVYLIGTWTGRHGLRAIGTGCHAVVMAGLAVFSLSAPAFSPVAPWTVIFTAWLVVFFRENLEAANGD